MLSDGDSFTESDNKALPQPLDGFVLSDRSIHRERTIKRPSAVAAVLSDGDSIHRDRQ